MIGFIQQRGRMPTNPADTAHATTSPSQRKGAEGASRLLLLLLLLLFLLFLVLLLLARGLYDGRRDTVEVALAVLRDAAAAVVGLLEHADLLERLADLALHGRGAVRVVRGAVAAAVAATVELGQGADADVFPEVDVSCDRG